VAVRGSIRNGAIWMMSDHPGITMIEKNYYYTPRTIFLELPFRSCCEKFLAVDYSVVLLG